MPPSDLHVLGTPPAFILSQDQTLRIIFAFYHSFKWFFLPYPGPSLLPYHSSIVKVQLPRTLHHSRQKFRCLLITALTSASVHDAFGSETLIRLLSIRFSARPLSCWACFIIRVSHCLSRGFWGNFPAHLITVRKRFSSHPAFGQIIPALSALSRPDRRLLLLLIPLAWMPGF